MKRVPWHVRGLDPDAREAARDAARRSGVSVGEWLNSVIAGAAEDAAETGTDGDSFSANFESASGTDTDENAVPINHQIDELKSQLDRLSQVSRPAAAPRREANPPPQGLDHVLAEITARQLALDGEATAPQSSPAAASGYAAAPGQAAAVEDQLRDIAARIKVLQSTGRGGSAITAPRPPAAAAPAPMAGVEKQLRRITGQIDGLRSDPTVDRLAESLRRDLAEMHRKMDAQASETDSLEKQIQTLVGEVTRLARPPRAEEIAEVLRSDLVEIRQTLKNTMARQDGASLEEQVREVARQVARLSPGFSAEEVARALRQDMESWGASLKSAIRQDAAASIRENFQAFGGPVGGGLGGASGGRPYGQPPASLPSDDIANALRRDLAEMGAALRDAMPAKALAGLEQEIRGLSERIETSRASGNGGAGLGDLANNLAEIRDRLRAMAPAEDLVQLNDAIKALLRRGDAIVPAGATAETVQQLADATLALHDLVSRSASHEAVAALSGEIRALAEKVGRSDRDHTSTDVMSMLDRRLAEMSAAFGQSTAVPPELDRITTRLSDRLASIEQPAFDNPVMKSIEQRMGALVDRLDASEKRIVRLDNVELSMQELLQQFKGLREENDQKLESIQRQLIASTAEAINGPTEAIRREFATLKEIQASADRRNQDTFEAMYGHIEQVVDRLAHIEEGLHGRDASHSSEPPDWPGGPEGGGDPTRSSAPEAADTGAAGHQERGAVDPTTPSGLTGAPGASGPGSARGEQAAWAAAQRSGAVSELEPDAPLEPGSGGRRVRIVANAIDRIAASEAVNQGVRPAETATPVKANFVAVARRAAQAVLNEQTGPDAPRAVVGKPDRPAGGARSLARRFTPRIKSVLVGIGVVVLVLGAVRLAIGYLHGSGGAAGGRPPVTRFDEPAQPGAGPNPAADTTAPAEDARGRKGAALETGPTGSFAMPGMPLLAAMATPGLGSAPVTISSGSPAAAQGRAGASGGMPGGIAESQIRDATGSILAAPAGESGKPLPPAIGSKALIAAANAGEAGACYEVAMRLSEGRNVPLDMEAAAVWFDRAARSGMAPAQFRLGSMFEKGLGVKKDLQEARRLYLAAADKGSAKAMHNLAVLYAEGIDGSPDFAVAAQWFGKAAVYGVVDSQFNLAILYARGVGVEASVVEAYKWFGLAAKGGDRDASTKRDEIGSRLDARQLDAARRAVEAFVPDREPDEATATQAPLGGWGATVAAAAPAPAQAKQKAR